MGEFLSNSPLVTDALIGLLVVLAWRFRSITYRDSKREIEITAGKAPPALHETERSGDPRSSARMSP